jgi:hypothetical protein
MGNPHIGHAREYSDSRELILSRGNEGAWISEVVDSAGNVGYHISLALDGSDWPRMSYERVPSPPPYHNSGYELRQAAWNGSTWDIDVIETSHELIETTSTAVDSTGNSHISYSRLVGGNWTLKYATSNGSAWSIEVVDADGSVGIFSDLALDTQDRPHIGYYDLANRDLKYAWWDGSAWNVSAVDSEGWVGAGTSIALDGNDRPHIAYFESGRQDPKYAFWNGSGWNFEIVDSDSSFVHVLSLALDGDDLPHMSYFDRPNMDVKYATKAELPSPSDSLTLDIDPDTLNLKSRGRWITAYLSAENAAVQDMNVSTILLQDALAPERWDYQGDVLMLKFDRQALIAILEVGESMEIKVSGKWMDGTAFEAYDVIRVIDPGT